MAGEWETLSVGEAPVEIIDGDRGVNYPKQEDFAPSGDCLFLNTGNVTKTGFNFSDRSFITKKKDAALRKGKLQRYDVVLTTRGTVGNVALFDDSVPYHDVRINSGMVLLRADRSKLLPSFLYQFVRSPVFKEQVAGLSTGSAQPQLPIRDIRRIEISLPPLPEQKAITAVLGALDDKIELNRRMNATLEAMARALFQSWFVDFLPVRANMAAKNEDPLQTLPETESGVWFVYALECDGGSFYIGQTEDLRQRWLQHTEGRGGRWTKGHTPKQLAYWERQPSRAAAVEREKWLKTGFGRKWLKKQIAARTQTGDPVRAKAEGRPPAGLDEPTAALFPAQFQASELGEIPQGWEVRSLDQIATYLNGLALQKFPPGDEPTLPVIKISQLRKGDSTGADRCNTELPPAYIVQDGDVLFSWSGSLEVELWCGGPGALNQHLFKVTSGEFPKWFYYLWTLHHLDDFRRTAASKATTMGHIQRKHLTAAMTLVPPLPLLEVMNLVFSPLIEQIVANRVQSRTLATLRDTLLPKLLSGVISV